MRFIIIIMLGLQQSPGRCKSLTWKNLSTRLPVLTSHLITTLETPQVRSPPPMLQMINHEHNPSDQTFPPVLQTCVPKLTAQRTKSNEEKQLLSCFFFPPRHYNCVNSSCLCRPKNSVCNFFAYVLFRFLCRTKILDLCTICRFH